MLNRYGTEDRYMVITYMARDGKRYRNIGPVLARTKDFLHYYLAGTELSIDAIGYYTVRDYPLGTTEDQAFDFYISGFNELERAANAMMN